MLTISGDSSTDSLTPPALPADGGQP